MNDSNLPPRWYIDVTGPESLTPDFVVGPYLDDGVAEHDAGRLRALAGDPDWDIQVYPMNRIDDALEYLANLYER